MQFGDLAIKMYCLCVWQVSKATMIQILFTFSHYVVVARGSIVFTKKNRSLNFAWFARFESQNSKKVVFGGGDVCLSVGLSDEYLKNYWADLDHILDLAVFWLSLETFFLFFEYICLFFRVATIQKKCRKTQFFRFSQFSRKRRYKSFSFFTRWIHVR